MYRVYKELVLYISCILFLFSVSLWYVFDFNQVGFQFLTEFYLFDSCVLIGLDSISMCFLFLTTLIAPLCFVYNWKTCNSLEEHFNFFLNFMFLEILLLIVFVVLDLIVFYLVFEFILIPFYFVVVSIKVSPYKRLFFKKNIKLHAFFLLFFYTIGGSLLMLFSILFIFLDSGTSMIPLLWYWTYDSWVEYLLWMCFFVSFSIKIPILPMHLWLPEAHVESPTEGSVILAAILLKIGAYGFIRVLIPFFFNATMYFSSLVYTLCIVSVLYTSMSAAIQSDIKRVIAYASIGHMNLCIMGLFSFSLLSFSGSIALMIAHGLASAGLFFSIGVLYGRFHTKNMKYYNGISFVMPLFSFFFFFFTVSNFSLPGTFSFVGELLIFSSFFYKYIFFIHTCVIMSILLSSFYSINLFNRIVYSNPVKKHIYNTYDVTVLEFFIFFILFLFIFILGFFPSIVLDYLSSDLFFYFEPYFVS